MPEIFIVMQALQLFWLVGLTYTTAVRKPGVDAALAVKRAEEDFMRQLNSHRDVTTRELRDQLLQINAIETHMQHMPSKEKLAELEGTVKTIEERTQGIAETLKVLQTSQQRIESYLLNTGR